MSNTYDLLAGLRLALKENAAGNWTDAQLVQFLSTAYEKVYGRQVLLFEDWTIKRGLVSVVSGTQEYAMPSDLKKLRMVEVYYGGEWFPLERVNFCDRHQFDHNITAELDPQVFRYYLYGETIGLVPKPSTSITDGLRLTYNPTSGYLDYGTALSGGATSIGLAATARSLDDVYNDMYVHIISGTAAGELVQITDYDGGTKVATAAFGTTPDVTSVYAIVPKTKPEFDRPIIMLAAAYALFNHDAPGYKLMYDTYVRELDDAENEMDVRDRGTRYIRYFDRSNDML